MIVPFIIALFSLSAAPATARADTPQQVTTPSSQNARYQDLMKQAQRITRMKNVSSLSAVAAFGQEFPVGDYCRSGCVSDYMEDWANCRPAPPNDYESTDIQEQCRNAADDKFGTCMAGCPM